MFKWFTLLCIRLSKRLGPFDVGRAICDFVSNVILWTLLLLIAVGRATGTSYWYAALVVVSLCTAVLYIMTRHILGHPCVSVKIPSTYELDCHERVRARLEAMGGSSCMYTSAFNGSDAELEYIDNYVVNLIREHIRDVPMFEKVCNDRYTGEVVFYRDRGEAASVWYKFGLSLKTSSAFHSVSTNVSHVYLGDKSYVELVMVLMHERLHSMAVDESVVTFATMFLLLKYGTIEEKDYAKMCVRSYCNDCRYGGYDQYSYCVKYFDQYWERVAN